MDRLSSAADRSEQFGDGSFSEPSDITQDFSKANLRLLMDEDPGWKATEVLFDDCASYLKHHMHNESTFDLLENFEHLCRDQISILRKIIERGAPGKQKFCRTVEMLKYIEAELWTWRLFRFFYGSRLNNKVDTTATEEVEMFSNMADGDKWQFLYDTDVRFREFRLTVDWCQQNALDILDTHKSPNFFAEKTFLWENTLHNLKVGRTHSKKPITQMDIDAPVRENASLDDIDTADEQRFIRILFSYVRAGALDRAVDLCVHCGQSWRAATIKACVPRKNTTKSTIDDNESETVAVGTVSRDIWKLMVWRFCDNAALPLMERALYGALAGHFPSLRPLCTTWEDTLWALTLSSAEYLFEQFLRRYPSRELAEMPSTLSFNEQEDITMESILRHIETTDDERIREEGKAPFRRLHAFILLDQPAEAVEFISTYLTQQGQNVPKHLVRLFAHLVIVFRMLKFDISAEHSNKVIEFYAEMLTADGRTGLVAFYTSMLPDVVQHVLYAGVLENVTDDEQKHHLLRLASDSGLDVVQICQTIVDNIRISYQPNKRLSMLRERALDGSKTGANIVSAYTATSISKEDLSLVNAVKWLLIDPNPRGDAILQANTIARIFLHESNLPAMAKVFSLLPADSVEVATEEWMNENGSEELNIEQQNCLREYACHKVYLNAYKCFCQWFESFQQANSTLDQSLSNVSSSSRLQQLAVAELNKTRAEENLKHKKNLLRPLTEVCIQALKDVLLFPDGGWMVDIESPIEDHDRYDELTRLQIQCLPMITNMLVTVLHSSGRYRDVLQLADLVASETTTLYKVFSKGQMKVFMERLTLSSIAALEDNCDFLGYPLSE